MFRQRNRIFHWSLKFSNMWKEDGEMKNLIVISIKFRKSMEEVHHRWITLNSWDYHNLFLRILSSVVDFECKQTSVLLMICRNDNNFCRWTIKKGSSSCCSLYVLDLELFNLCMCVCVFFFGQWWSTIVFSCIEHTFSFLYLVPVVFYCIMIVFYCLQNREVIINILLLKD